jgi:hypothetical protein
VRTAMLCALWNRTTRGGLLGVAFMLRRGLAASISTDLCHCKLSRWRLKGVATGAEVNLGRSGYQEQRVAVLSQCNADR